MIKRISATTRGSKMIIKRSSKHPKYVIDSSKNSISFMLCGSASDVLLIFWFLSIDQPYLRKQFVFRVLIGYNLSSHISQAAIQTYNENNIRIMLIPTNFTAIYQPLDVEFFGPLKRKWSAVLLQCKQKIGESP